MRFDIAYRIGPRANPRIAIASDLRADRASRGTRSSSTSRPRSPARRLSERSKSGAKRISSTRPGPLYRKCLVLLGGNDVDHLFASHGHDLTALARRALDEFPARPCRLAPRSLPRQFCTDFTDPKRLCESLSASRPGKGTRQRAVSLLTATSAESASSPPHLVRGNLSPRTKCTQTCLLRAIRVGRVTFPLIRLVTSNH